MGIFRSRTLALGAAAASVSEAPVALDASSGPAFDIDLESIDPVMLGLTPDTLPTAPAPRIDRRSAMQVPAVKRARDLVCSTLGGLPVDVINGGRDAIDNGLFRQPEKNVPRSVTMTQTFEDMFFEGRAWWRILSFQWSGFPGAGDVKKLDYKTVYHDKATGRVFVDGKFVPDEQLIRWDSPTDGLLIAGARAIRTALQLDAAAATRSDGAPPVDYFAPAEGADPADDDEIREILKAWQDARRRRSTGYVPAALSYHTGGLSPKDLQLQEARQHAVLEIARVTGVDPEELGVSTTSRTYANQFDRRKNYTDFTLGQYRQAFEDRASMGDVTPRGQFVKLNLSAFLRSDDKTRMETYKLGLDVGAYGEDEIRELEDKPPLDPAQRRKPAPAPAAVPITGDPMSSSPTLLPSLAVAAAGDLAAAFTGTEPAIRLDNPQSAQQFSVDTANRVIRGLAVPYGKVGVSNGQRYQFSKGTLKFADVKRVKLWVQHDKNKAVGVATKLDDQDDGLHAEFSIARGKEGDRVLALAEDGVLDGLSIGLGLGGRFTARDGVQHAVEAPLMEVSLTPAPSFDDARLHGLAADADGGPGGGAGGAAPVVGQDAFGAIGKAIAAGLAFAQPAGREHVSNGGVHMEINEAPLYRFDGTEGEHDFSSDLIAGLGLGSSVAAPDGEAYARVLAFMAEQFGPPKFVATTDTAAVNPTQYRPDMFVNEQRLATPLKDAFYKGVLTDVTPFSFSKFNDATNLVSDHVQGVEPNAGTYSTATAVTITPAPVSGKVHITREVGDQGGNPQVSALIWSKIEYEYRKAMELKAAAMLAASNPGELGDLIAAGSKTIETLADPIENAIARLNFVAGGNRFNYLPAHLDLYLAMRGLRDADKRPYYPIIAPVNANGQTVAGYQSLTVAGNRFDPVWSLGTTSDGTAHRSYAADTSSVWFWHSAPKRLDRLQERVEGWDLGVWGYWAGVISDITGLKKITYDPTA